MTASTNTAATEAPAKRKPGRPKKVQEAETAVDFKTLAAETRAKMGGAKTLLADIAEIQAAPPEAADVLVPGDTAISVQNSITVSDLALGTLGLHEVPLSQTTRSSCNVRSHYDPAAIEELAASLAAQGQQQNATGRWNAEGQIEIVAGESRRRAQLLRMERGEITYGHPFLVRISEMTDGEALAASATENMRRRSMTPLEECEAMQRLQDTGRTVEDLAALFGYKTLQPVADRILVARNLLTTPRELLDRGQLSLAQAFVIARAPGAALQNSMTEAATSKYQPSSAVELTRTLTRGQMLVEFAKFNVEKSGLDVMRDLFDAYEPYFKDKAKALEAQIAWANGRAEKLREGGKHAFVAVETGESSHFTSSSFRNYEYGSDPKRRGLIFYICTATGQVKQEDSYQLKVAAKIDETTGSAEKVQTERQMPESAYLEAHQLRAYAAREAAVGDTHLTLALTVWGMLIGGSEMGRARISEVQGLPNNDKMAALMPTLYARREALRALIAPVEESRSYSSQTALGGHTPKSDPLLALLLGLEDSDLLEHLNTLVAVTAYDWSAYNPKEVVRSEYARVAARTDAASVLARSFALTDEWLKRYPRSDLVKLAEEAGLGRALVEDCKTLKEMRGRLLEHAERLHREGFVPSLVKFPAVKA